VPAHLPPGHVRDRRRVGGSADGRAVGGRARRGRVGRRADRGHLRRGERDRRAADRGRQPRGAVGHAGPGQPGPGIAPGAGEREIAVRPRRLDRHRRSVRARPGQRAQQGALCRAARVRVAELRLPLGRVTMTEVLTGAQILCRVLLEEGVEVIWGYPGGPIMPFYHALPDHPRLRHVLVRHEQAAAHAADGYARASGRAGVCVATSGPGATNLVTGLATAHMDNTPVVAITGQVARAMMGRDAFQETDIIGITQPITKHSWLIEDAEELADAVHQAFAVALEGRPGPVLIDIPKDVQNQKVDGKAVGRYGGTSGRATALPPYRPSAIAEAVQLIAEAER